jgi:homoserine kinase type II
MPLQSLKLDKKALTDIAAEYGVGKPGTASRALPEWGGKRYLIEVAKQRYELLVRAPEDEFDLRRELDLLAFLEKHNFPSPRPMTDRRGRQFLEREGCYLVLYKVPTGTIVGEGQFECDQIHSIGKMLGELHMVGRGYKKAIDNRYGFERIFESYAGVRRRMPHYFKKIVRTLDEEIEYLGNYLETKLPKGIIHGAVHRWSLLMNGDDALCLSDFDAACRGKYVYDLATAVNALCFREKSYDLERFEALMAGYESLRTLSLAEWDSFPNELRFAGLRFAIIRLTGFFEAEEEERARINDDFRCYLERLRVLRREEEGGMDKLLMAMATGYDYRKYQRVKSGEFESEDGGDDLAVSSGEEEE